MNGLSLLTFGLLACQLSEGEDYSDDIDDIRAQLFQQQAIIEELQRQNDELYTNNAELQSQLDNMTSGVDLVDLYATVNQNVQKISANSSSLNTQSSSIANNTNQINANSLDIDTNSSTIQNNYNHN